MIAVDVVSAAAAAAATTAAVETSLFLRGGMTGRPGANSGPSRPYQGHAVAVHTAVSNPVKTQASCLPGFCV